MSIVPAEEVVSFWRDAGHERWYKSDPHFDREIRERFLQSHEAAAAGRLPEWRQSPEGALALLILLDQFPRNMFRGTPRAFATDALAREVADDAIGQGFDQKVDAKMQSFFYLPFMHSEKLADQERCLALYGAADNEEGLKFAKLHLDPVRRFGRFPHRNKVLGRKSTPEEIEFLESGGFSA